MYSFLMRLNSLMLVLMSETVETLHYLFLVVFANLRVVWICLILVSVLNSSCQSLKILRLIQC